MTDAEIDHLRAKVRKLPSPEGVVLLTFRDIVSGLQIFMLVFLCTLPVALPFAFVDDVAMALRTSNGVALMMLFIGGFKLARYAGFRPWLTALTYMVIGFVLVSVTMALGG
jgi:VIT1/CCC1 family predicted Fe2+/Mn2+ transporter